MADYQAGLDEILDACLQAIETQGWTVDDCLAHYASYRDDLEPLLRTAEQFRPARLLSPSPAFREQALPRLRARLAQTARPGSRPTPSRPTGRPQPFYAQRRLALGFSALIIVVGLAAITTGTIYASGSALPGDLLFPVAQTIEQVQLGFARPEQALGLRMDLAEKRLGEAEQLRKRGDEGHMQEALDGYSRLISDVTQSVSSGSGADDQALLDEISTRLLYHQDRLGALLMTASPEAQAGIAAAIEASGRGQESVSQAIKDLGGGVPEQTHIPAVPTQATSTSMPPLASTQTNTSVQETAEMADTTVPASIEPTTMPAPTDTVLPTEEPAATNTVSPTDVPIPANTPVPSCDNVAMAWRDTTGNSARVTITNTNDSPIALTGVEITWPESNKNLKHIKFTGILWSGDAAPESFSTGVSGPSAVLDPASQTSTDLIFQFVAKASPGGYAITVTVDIGCVLTVNN